MMFFKLLRLNIVAIFFYLKIVEYFFLKNPTGFFCFRWLGRWFRPSFCVRWLGRSPAVALEKPSPSAALSEFSAPAIKIEEASSAAEAIEEASSAAKSLAAVPAAEVIEEASFAAKLLAAVPEEAIEEASLAAKSLAEVRAAWIEKASSVAEALEGVPEAEAIEGVSAASFKEVYTSEVWEEINIGLGDSSTALEVCGSANPGGGGGGGDLSPPVHATACLPTGLQLLLNNSCKLYISTCDPHQHTVLNSSSCHKHAGLELRAFLRRARMDPVFLKSHLQSDCEEFETQIYGMPAALIGYCLIGKEKQFDQPLLLFWEYTDPLIISVPRSNNPSGRQIALKDEILNERSFITVCVTLQMLMNGKLGCGKPRFKTRITMVHFGGLHATVEIVLPTNLMVEHRLYRELIWEYIRAVHTSRLSGGAAKMPRTANWSPEADFYRELFRTQKFVRRVSSTELGAALVNKESNDELRAFLRRARMDPVFLKSHLQSDCEEFETQIYGMPATLIGCCLIGKEKQFDQPLLLFWEYTDPLIISVPRSNNPSGRQIALKDEILNERSFITVCVTLQMLMSGKPRFKTRITMVHFGGLHATVEIVLPTKLMVEHRLYRELIWEYIRAVHTSRLSGGAAKMPRTANWSPEADFYRELFRTQKFVRRVSSTELGAALVNKESNDHEISTQVITSYMLMGVIKKALASKQADKTTRKMKKNALTVERSNHEYVGSSPHPRRLRSSGNQNTSESRLPINSNGRMISKLTLSRPNLTTEHRGVYLLKSSVEDAEAGTNRIKFGSLNLKVHDRVTQEKNPHVDTSFSSPTRSFSFSNQNLSQINVRTVEGLASKVHTKTSEGVPPEENTRCREVISHDDRRLMGNTNGRRPHFTTEHGSFRLLRLSLEDANRERKSESPNLNVHTKTFEDVPREEKKHNLKVSLEGDPDATYSKAFSDPDLNHFCRRACNSCCRGPLSKTTNRYRVSSRQSESIYWSRKPERLVSSDETRHSNKSLQINDYDKELRKYHGPSGTSSSKFSRVSDIDRRSRTVDARSSWREQQSKDTQPLVNVSRIVPHDVLPGAPARLLTCDNVRRETEFYGETFSSMKFAQRVSAVEFCASWVNNESTDAPDLEESVTTKSPLSSTQNITNELADGQRILVLAAGSSKDLNNEAMRLSNGGMGCTEMLAENDVSHEQDSVPVRTVSRSLIEQLAALNIKARRVQAQKVNAQGGCDEKGKCAEVVIGRDSSSGITSYDAQNAKLKERPRQRANELQKEGERKRTQKTRAMVKLEELNMHRNNRDVPDQSKEQQVYHSHAKGSISDSVPEQDSVPVRTVSRSLIEQLEALNIKARRVEAHKVNAQGGCDEKGKCAEVANGRGSSSGITSFDAQNAKMKERARPDQSKEQQIHHSYAKGSVNDSVPEQDSVPVRTVSRSLIEQLEALNIKARRVEAQKVNAQGGCDEKGKCADVANGRDSSSGITSFDAQNAKMKERARQRAIELQEEEEERKRTQKARAMVKLEELNMRRNNRDMSDQSKEQQIHHSYAKGSVNDSVPVKDYVPVRNFSRSLIEQLEALNIKARRVEAQKVNAQGGCDEKGKCTEVANGRDSSSGITSFDAQNVNVKMKERARQPANELQEEEEERKRTQKARAMVKLEELNMRRNSRDMPDQSKEQQVHHSYAKGSVKNGNLIDACDQRIYCAQLSETAFFQSRRGVDIDRKLPMFDARSNRMPSGKPTVGALPGSLPPRSRSFWIEKSSSEKAVSETPRKRSVWVEKTMMGRTAPTLPPRTTKSVWIEKRRNM